MRDPTGSEPSALLDPPLEGPGGRAGLTHDIMLPFQGSASFRNGDLITQVSSGVLSFWRVEPNGSSTLLTSEYTDTKTLPPRSYTQDFRASSFAAEFSFSSEPEEQFYGAGQQACCKDHTVNKKGQVVDLINYNSHVTLPVYMSNKVGCSAVCHLLYQLMFGWGRRGIFSSSICLVKDDSVRAYQGHPSCPWTYSRLHQSSVPSVHVL